MKAKVVAVVSAAFLLFWLASAAIAKDDEKCEGLVQVGYADRSIIIDRLGDSVCEFQTYSRTGRQILAECPDASMCSVSVPLKGDFGALIDNGSVKTIVEVRAVDRIQP